MGDLIKNGAKTSPLFWKLNKKYHTVGTGPKSTNKMTNKKYHTVGTGPKSTNKMTNKKIPHCRNRSKIESKSNRNRCDIEIP